MAPLLEFRNVTKIFKGGTIALDNISFAVEADETGIVAIAGESGSGKSTLGLMALNFLEPTNGTVMYKGKNVRQFSKQEQKEFRKDVQAVFQDPFATYNPFYKVDHILDVPIKQFKLAPSKDAAKEMVQEALESVGLRPNEILGRFPHQLSGGQRQRLVVARALLLKPHLLIADEPVSMVDASLRATILESLYKLNRDFGIPILYITHDLTTAYHVSDYIIILYRGSIMEAGDVETVIKNPQHPYTQLLIDSIPWPDLQQTWGQQEIIIPTGPPTAATSHGCKFARRCPQAMDVCWKAPPPPFKTDKTRVAACYLHEAAPTITKEEIAGLFARHKRQAAI